MAGSFGSYGSYGSYGTEKPNNNYLPVGLETIDSQGFKQRIGAAKWNELYGANGTISKSADRWAGKDGLENVTGQQVREEGEGLPAWNNVNNTPEPPPPPEPIVIEEPVINTKYKRLVDKDWDSIIREGLINAQKQNRSVYQKQPIVSANYNSSGSSSLQSKS